jgi:hypothetical protein
LTYAFIRKEKELREKNIKQKQDKFSKPEVNTGLKRKRESSPFSEKPTTGVKRRKENNLTVPKPVRGDKTKSQQIVTSEKIAKHFCQPDNDLYKQDLHGATAATTANSKRRKEKIKKRTARAHMTLQDKIIYRLKDKKRKQIERLHIPPQQTQIENSKAKSRMTNVRDNKTCEQKKDWRVNDKTRKQEERSNMSPEQKVKRVDVYLEVRKRRGHIFFE